MSEHHLALLEQGCKALVRLVEAREVIDRDGIAIPDRYGVLKQHPACAIERDQRIALVRIIRELNLDEEEEHVRGPGRSW
jgi:phage terminase small subunit